MTHLGNIVFNLGRCFSPLGRLSPLWRRTASALYTGYMAPRFNTFGRSSRIMPRFTTLAGAERISVGDKCWIGADVTLTAVTSWMNRSFEPVITIGDGSVIGDTAHITAINRITIGRNVLTGKKILITDNAHGASDATLLTIPPNERPLISPGPVVIEDNVWLGEHVSVMPGVTIGKGSIVGCGSVVTRSIPPGSVAAGIPARVIKTLD